MTFFEHGNMDEWRLHNTLQIIQRITVAKLLHGGA